MRRGGNWAGIVEHVVVMGAPVSTRLERWAMARSVVAGRFVNAYSRRDWVLGLIYRGANGELLQSPLPRQGLCTCVSQVFLAGRFVNAYSRRDWVLGLIYRGANGELLPSVWHLLFRAS